MRISTDAVFTKFWWQPLTNLDNFSEGVSPFSCQAAASEVHRVDRRGILDTFTNNWNHHINGIRNVTIILKEEV